MQPDTTEDMKAIDFTIPHHSWNEARAIMLLVTTPRLEPHIHWWVDQVAGLQVHATAPPRQKNGCIEASLIQRSSCATQLAY